MAALTFSLGAQLGEAEIGRSLCVQVHPGLHRPYLNKINNTERAHTCNPSTKKTEAGGSEFKDILGL